MLGKLLRFMIRGYQIVISGGRAPCCRFSPSCSDYALAALQQHGPFTGMRLVLWRILRCNPWGKSGYDPVPLPAKPRKKYETN